MMTVIEIGARASASVFSMRPLDELIHLVWLCSLIMISLTFVTFALIFWIGFCEVKDRIKDWLYDRKHPFAANRSTAPLGLGNTKV